MQVVSENYQKYQDRAVSNQLKDIGGETMFEMTVNLLMRDIGGKCTEAEFLGELQTKVFTVFLLATFRVTYTALH
jgi:hypothetical protein